MDALDTIVLRKPIDTDEPCGPNLEYDTEFLELEAASRSRPEHRYADKSVPAQPSDWKAVYSLATALFRRTKDLRVAMYWLRAATRLHGWIGLASGLRLLEGLLRDYWYEIHPRADPDDPADLTLRYNVLRSLSDPGTFLADVRAATPDGALEGPSIRQLEIA